MESDDFTRQCYILKNITSLPMWAGTIVHELIKANLNLIKGNRPPLTLEALKNRAVQYLRQGWRQSKSGEWRNDPKRITNLFEHYYDKGITQAAADELKQKVLTCCENFYNSQLYQEILGLKRPNSLTIEELNSFQLEGVKVWVVMDCAYEVADESFKIIDWKTGMKGDDYKEQIALYALYSMENFGYSADNIETVLYFLASDELLLPDVSADDLANLKARVQSSVAEMEALLNDVENNEASMENFPKNTSLCPFCQFQAICAS